MSVKSLTSDYTVTIKRVSETKDGMGGPVRTFSTANRGSLPTLISCALQSLDGEEREAYGVRASSEAWMMFTDTDPQMDLRDQIVFTDDSSVSHTAFCIRRSIDEAGKNRVWTTFVEEHKGEV